MDNSPNVNIVVVNEIEGLASEIIGKLDEIKYDTPEQLRVLLSIRSNMNDWFKSQISSLRRVFE